MAMHLAVLSFLRIDDSVIKGVYTCIRTSVRLYVLAVIELG